MAQDLACMYQVQLEGAGTLPLAGVLHKHQFGSVDLRSFHSFHPC